MKKVFVACMVLLAVMTGLFFAVCEKPKISSPEIIVLEKGKRFTFDDYIKIYGEGISVEYIDNININEEGEYTLTVRAWDKKGNKSEKNIKVTVKECG